MRFAVVCLVLLCSAAQAQSGSSGFFLEPVTEPGSISLPTSAVPSPTGDLYVTQYAGFVKLVRPSTGEVVSEPVINIFSEILVSGDRSLVGMTLHPDFPATPHVYLVYPVDTPGPRPESSFRGYSRLTRFTLNETLDGVVPGSKRVLLGATPETGIVSCYNSHSANSLLFGHDGALYVSHGDGASWAEPDPGGLYPECFDGTGIDPDQDIGSYRAQSLESLSGKVLRLDPETGLGLPDNPFWTGDGSDPASKIWAMGFRNPFRMALVPQDPDNPERTEIVVGDVGSGLYEELNRATGGENFGWPCIEGPEPNPGFTDLTVTDGTDCSTPRAGTLTAPWAYFSHTDPEASAPAGRLAFSITGGSFYQGTQYPERFQDALFFADFSEGWITAGRLGDDGLLQPEEAVADAGAIVDLTYDPLTETFYTVDINNASISRLRFAGEDGAPPVARGTVSEPFGELPHQVVFSDDGSVDPGGGELTYSWSFGDGEGAEGRTASHTYTTPGIYAATLTVTAADGRAAQSIVRVSVGLSLPTLEIREPTVFVTSPSGRFSLDAQASDPRLETLDLFWEVDLVHNAHVHPSFNRVDGPVGEIVAPSHAGPGEVAFYRARAVVVDEEGLRVERERTVRSYDAAEIGAAGRPAPDAPARLFANPLEMGRVSVPTASVTGPLSVEVLGDDGWQAVRQPHTLAEGETTQVVFASAFARGVRIAGAAADSLVAYPRLDPDAEIGGWDPAGAAGVDGRTNRFGDAGLVLAANGRAADGAFYLARRPVANGESVTVRLDALDGRDGAFAGVALTTGLDGQATTVAIGRTQDGTAQTVVKRGASIEVSPFGTADGPLWLRATRTSGGFVTAEVSADSVTWVRRQVVSVDADAAMTGGPVVAGGDAGAVAWFGAAAAGAGIDANPVSVGEVTVAEAFPNPGKGRMVVLIDAGFAGEYVASVVDTRGREVMRFDGIQTGEPQQIAVDVDRRGLAQGVYVFRVSHVGTGATAVRQFSVIR